MATLEEKLANDARLNGIYQPKVSDIPPKAVNNFMQGISPESIGSGEQVGITKIGRITFDPVNGRIIIADETGIDRVLMGFLENGF